MGFVRCVVVMSVLLSCASVWSGCGASDRLYAEYVLPEPAKPESIDCYEECELSFVKSGREACFARCDGVVERFTDAPCKERGVGRCSFDRLSPGEESAAQNAVNSTWLADFLGRVFAGLIAGSRSHGDVEARADGESHSHQAPHAARRGTPPASRNVAARHRATPRRGS
jgi:hypothetical protein